MDNSTVTYTLVAPGSMGYPGNMRERRVSVRLGELAIGGGGRGAGVVWTPGNPCPAPPGIKTKQL